MAEPFDLVIRNGAVATPNGVEMLDIGVRERRIAELGKIAATAPKAAPLKNPNRTAADDGPGLSAIVMSSLFQAFRDYLLCCAKPRHHARHIGQQVPSRTSHQTMHLIDRFADFAHGVQ